MPAWSARKLATFAPAALWLLAAQAAFGQAAPQADHGASKPADKEEKLPAYHHSIFSWEHSLTTQTVGVGDNPQSTNPTYTMGFVAKTRYYLVDDTPKGEHFSLRLDGALYREFTNSDVTTRRGEWDFSDTELYGVYARRFQGPVDTDGTFLELRPLVWLPTAKRSYDSGRYFAPGALVGVTNVTPWFRGHGGPEISSALGLAVAYKRWFARATVPTNPSLERVRLTPDGHSFASDELSGSSLVRDQIDFSARLRLAFGENVYWSTEAALSPAWKYDVQNQVPLCGGVILTGCVPVQVSPDDSRYLVQTEFNTEVSVRIAKGFSIELGYGNIANQLGLDGRRRNFFYSPAATFYASVSFFPHELVTGSKQLAQNGAATPNL